MPANLLINIKITVCNKLQQLDPLLSYHNLLHTLDVMEQCETIAIQEKTPTEEDRFLLQVAALYHDTGFLKTYAEHEKISCAIFLEDADRFGIEKPQQQVVTGLIMATRIPQQPTNLLERIICDADLDYLGRDDFFEIADSLKKEFLHYQIVKTNAEWEHVQLKFLKNHQYHTPSSHRIREQAKQLHYQQLLAQSSPK